MGRAMKRDADKDALQPGSKHKRAAMKPAGEGDENPTHTAGLKDEFSELEQQYDSASIEERDRRHPNFIRAIREKYPGLEEETWRALRNDESLKATLHYSMKRLLDRHDLSAGRKINAREDADAAMWLIDELLRADLEPKEMIGHAYELAARFLFIGLRAGLSPEEVDALQARRMSDRQRKLGKTPKKPKPWRAYAGMLLALIPEKDRALPIDRVGGKLWDLWAAEVPAQWTGAKPSRPSFRSLTSFVSNLRARS
jgi:hypothetical protein